MPVSVFCQKESLITLTWASQNQKEWKNDFLKIVANISKNYIFEKIIKGRIKRDGINNNKVSE